jgi:hypothetical protein
VRISILALCAAALAGAVDARGDILSDAITVGTVVVAESDGTVRVPVYVLDAPGTPLGVDQPAGKRISFIGFNVIYGPDPCLDTVEPYFDLSKGILAGVQLQIFTAVGVPGTNQFIEVFHDERHTPIAFHETAPPGDLIGELVFARSGCGTKPSYLHIGDAGLSSIDNTTESASQGNLLLVDGSIALPGVAVPTPTVSPTITVTATPTVTPTFDARLGTPTPTPGFGGGGEGGGGGGGGATPVPVPTLDDTRLALLAAILALSGALLVRRGT